MLEKFHLTVLSSAPVVSSHMQPTKEEIMIGRTRNSLSLFVFTFLLFGTGCLEEYHNPALSGDTAQDGNVCPRPIPPIPPDPPRVEQLADENGDAEKGAISLTPMNLDAERSCALYSSPMHFEIEERTPGIFLLQPVTGLDYCVEVTRESGYITLRHDEGVVRREADLFIWCLKRLHDDLDSNGTSPARLEVTALTPSAGFEVTLKRGEE